MSEKASYVKCPKCGSDAFKLYEPEQIKEIAKGNIFIETELKRTYQCINKECSYVWRLSLKEISIAFNKLRKFGELNKDNVVLKYDKDSDKWSEKP